MKKPQKMNAKMHIEFPLLQGCKKKLNVSSTKAKPESRLKKGGKEGNDRGGGPVRIINKDGGPVKDKTVSMAWRHKSLHSYKQQSVLFCLQNYFC